MVGRPPLYKLCCLLAVILGLVSNTWATPSDWFSPMTTLASSSFRSRTTTTRTSITVFPRGGGAAAAAARTSSSRSTSTKEGPLRVFVGTIQKAKKDLAAAAVARSTSIFLMFPVDTIKTRIQMEQGNPFRLQGVFNGVAGSLLGQVPYGVLTFGSYETYKRTLLAKFPQVKPIFLYACAAVMGDLTGSGWLCPSEVVKQQTQAGMYASTRQAISGIWKKKGLVGFYEGYFGGISRDVPFRVTQLTTYELIKNLYIRVKRQRLEAASRKSNNTRRKVLAAADSKAVALTPAEAAVCGAVCGTVSAALTAPLDRIKTLLMTDSSAYGGTVVSCIAKIWQQEGLKGFTIGVLPRVTYIAPSVAIFFIAYEQVQQRLKDWE